MCQHTHCALSDTVFGEYCRHCDLMFGVDGFHVIGVDRQAGQLVVQVETCQPGLVGCPACGVLAHSHGRRVHKLVDAPCFGWPVQVQWRKRTWRCVEPACGVGVFTEQNEQLAKPRSLLTTRAIWWAISALGESASVEGLRRRLGCSWRTLWLAVKPVLQTMDADQARFNQVSILGVDEHIWHHKMPYERGPREVTGMVDLTRDKHGDTKARLLDLVPGRRGSVYAHWLRARTERGCQLVCVRGVVQFGKE